MCHFSQSCIRSSVFVMEGRSCSSGSVWDSLLKLCISHKFLELTPSHGTEVPPPVLKPVFSTRGLEESWSAVSPVVWICVGLVLSSSVLVLLFWHIIYRHHNRTSQNTGEKDSTPHATEAVQQEEEVLSPWLHLNGKTQEVPVTEGTCGRSMCNGWAEHGLPLPATELGDSALVTAKTGQPVDV
ncbi:tumor necrosis factor receptor superfamily member 17-like isoform X2 [Myxocyprinus asiaticus]|uniref:tumor necrosis factor receptor superfamily member 17-like isoform X2 n=1 Tax=Myxocyprinus asiaticus TaxID=70543 RepID=UPI002222A143|nr:tumor necrosis factor receptor superfamily member 17-like isoform X2 [Myxocyprinus asiaticus]